MKEWEETEKETQCKQEKYRKIEKIREAEWKGEK